MSLLSRVRDARLILLLLLVAGLVLRLVLVLTHDNMLGVDIGAYLISAQQVQGLYSAVDFTRPPLAPGWLLVPFVDIWGQDIGYKVFQAVFSLAPIPAVYLLSRQFTSTRVALLAAAFATVDLAHAEMLVTGALPLIGFGLIGVGLWSIGNILTGRATLKRAITLASTIPLLAFINMTTAGIAFIAFPVFVAAMIYFQRPAQGRVLVVLVAWLLGGIAALTALPWYMDVLPGSNDLQYGSRMVFFLAQGKLGWYIMPLALALGAFAVWKGTDARLRSIGVLIIVFGLLAALWSDDETLMNIFFRGQYFIAFLAYPVIAWAAVRWMPRVRPRVAAAAISVVIAVISFAYIQAFHAQAYYSDQVTTDTMSALAYLNETGDRSNVIVNTFSMGLVVEAVHGVHAPVVWNSAPPAKWEGEYEQVKCLLGWQSPCDTVTATSRLSAGHVLVDTSYPTRNDTMIYQAPANMWEVTGQSPWLKLVYERGSTRLWKIENTP